MRIFSNESACPSPRDLTAGRTASRGRAGSSRPTSNSNLVINEGSIITDEMIRGINKPVAVLHRIEILFPAVHEPLHGAKWLFIGKQHPVTDEE